MGRAVVGFGWTLHMLMYRSRSGNMSYFPRMVRSGGCFRLCNGLVGTDMTC